MKTFSLCVISDEQRILKNEKQYAEGKQLNKGGGGEVKVKSAWQG